MSKIGLISCVQLKKIGSHKAKDIYISPLFKKSKLYAEKNLDDYYILSAKYGLLNKDKYIEPYDLALTNFSKKKINQWSILVAKQIKKEIPNEDLYFLAGKNYYNYLIKYISNNKKILMKGLIIGKRLKYLDNNL